MPNIKTIPLVMLVFLFLPACGGDNGNSSSGSTNVGVTDNAPPIVSFSPADLTVNSGAQANSTLTATDNVGITSGPTVSCSEGGEFNVASNTFTAPTITADITTICTASAEDAAGNTGTSTLTVNVVAPNLPPVSIITGPEENTVIERQEFRFRSDSTDPENDTLSYRWNQVSGPQAGLGVPDEGSLFVIAPEIFNDSEELVFELTVSDGESENTSSITITVENVLLGERSKFFPELIDVLELGGRSAKVKGFTRLEDVGSGVGSVLGGGDVQGSLNLFYLEPNGTPEYEKITLPLFVDFENLTAIEDGDVITASSDFEEIVVPLNLENKTKVFQQRPGNQGLLEAAELISTSPCSVGFGDFGSGPFGATDIIIGSSTDGIDIFINDVRTQGNAGQGKFSSSFKLIESGNFCDLRVLDKFDTGASGTVNSIVGFNRDTNTLHYWRVITSNGETLPSGAIVQNREIVSTGEYQVDVPALTEIADIQFVGGRDTNNDRDRVLTAIALSIIDDPTIKLVSKQGESFNQDDVSWPLGVPISIELDFRNDILQPSIFAALDGFPNAVVFEATAPLDHDNLTANFSDPKYIDIGFNTSEIRFSQGMLYATSFEDARVRRFQGGGALIDPFD